MDMSMKISCKNSNFLHTMCARVRGLKRPVSEFEEKVSRALKKHRTRLQLPPVPNQPPDRGPQQEISAVKLMEEEMIDGLTTVSQDGSAASRMSKGPALLHKLRSQQRKIKAKATAISNVIG